jgi:hypothetical protein
MAFKNEQLRQNRINHVPSGGRKGLRKWFKKQRNKKLRKVSLDQKVHTNRYEGWAD